MLAQKSVPFGRRRLVIGCKRIQTPAPSFETLAGRRIKTPLREHVDPCLERRHLQPSAIAPHTMSGFTICDQKVKGVVFLGLKPLRTGECLLQRGLLEGGTDKGAPTLSSGIGMHHETIRDRHEHPGIIDTQPGAARLEIPGRQNVAIPPAMKSRRL
jgi:hypothetical protein